MPIVDRTRIDEPASTGQTPAVRDVLFESLMEASRQDALVDRLHTGSGEDAQRGVNSDAAGFVSLEDELVDLLAGSQR